MVADTQTVVPVRPEPIRDGYGRYVIPDPSTGKRRVWTRATTWARTVADTMALTRWQLRMTAIGLSRRSDLLAQVASVVDPDNKGQKQKLDRWVEEAMEHAGSAVGSNLGTALHSFVEHVDMGREVHIPEPWATDVAAYQEVMEQHQITVSRNYVERICLQQYFGIAGTMDRLVMRPGKPLPQVFDVKTQKTMQYGWTEIAIQLAIYAHADYVYDVDTDESYPMIPVDKKRAIVCHLPAGEGQCQLYEVDIDEGWRAVSLCGLVREWRKRRDLAWQLDK